VAGIEINSAFRATALDEHFNKLHSFTDSHRQSKFYVSKLVHHYSEKIRSGKAASNGFLQLGRL
jgi:outer membrane protease